MRKLVRRGSCNRCGNCCVANAPTGCQHYIVVDGKFVCTIYKDRPERCKTFPNHPRCISQHLECGFKFYDAKTGKEITKKPLANWEELDSYDEVKEEC